MGLKTPSRSQGATRVENLSELDALCVCASGLGIISSLCEETGSESLNTSKLAE